MDFSLYIMIFFLFADCAVRWRGPGSLPSPAVGGFTVDPSPQVCPRLRAGWSADEAHTKGINSVLPAGLQEHRRLLWQTCVRVPGHKCRLHSYRNVHSSHSDREINIALVVTESCTWICAWLTQLKRGYMTKLIVFVGLGHAWRYGQSGNEVAYTDIWGDSIWTISVWPYTATRARGNHGLIIIKSNGEVRF